MEQKPATVSCRGLLSNAVNAAATCGQMTFLVTKHGLRKAAARRLAEAGCSASQIAAITGHKTLKEVARYTAAASQAHLAKDAMAAQMRAEQEQKLADPSHKLASED